MYIIYQFNRSSPVSIVQSEAAQQYCATVEELEAADKGSGSSGDRDTGTSTQYQEIVVTDEAGARTILLNRPQKYNAMNFQV